MAARWEWAGNKLGWLRVGGGGVLIKLNNFELC